MGNFEQLAKLATFATWPIDTSGSCLSLAEAGFVYTGESDQITCPRCGLVIKDAGVLRRNVSPLDEHRQRSPMCPFFTESAATTSQLTAHPNRTHTERVASSSLQRASTSLDQSVSNLASIYQAATERAKRHGAINGDVRQTGNSLISRDCVSHDVTVADRVNPDYVQMRQERVRLSTYVDWPASDVVQPTDLARTGLFYTGQGDRTRCAFCRGILYSWQRGDVPEAEHRRHFPTCPFVRQRDVGNVPLQPSAASLERPMAALGVSDAKNSTSGQSGVNAAPVASAQRRDVDVTNVASNQSHQLDQAHQRTATVTRQTLRELSSAQQRSTEDVKIQNTNALEDEEQMLIEENRRLHDARTCKVCMDKEINTVFLPCGHLVSCDQCAPKLRDCAVCRVYIRGTVRTFLS